MAISRASLRSVSTFRMFALPATEARAFRKNPAVIAVSVVIMTQTSSNSSNENPWSDLLR